MFDIVRYITGIVALKD